MKLQIINGKVNTATQFKIIQTSSSDKFAHTQFTVSQKSVHALSQKDRGRGRFPLAHTL